MQRQAPVFVATDAGADRSKDSAPADWSAHQCGQVKTPPQEWVLASLPAAASAVRFPIPDSRFPIPDSRFPIPDSRFPIPDSRASVAHLETDADYPVAPEAMG
ncbi:hypothetical protein [Xanthomonas sp. BRIP62409]|uniref:hypothetical protein n=1 Tax=Xanthomonas sp. BRIP62409 TaxID=2182388 RepID=UPI000F8C3F3D|nr:hypothetical protein [Xanthomonas sp. BRIP62409]